MNDEIIALISAAVLAFIIRFFNVVILWLAKLLAVNPPEPIPPSPLSEVVHPKSPLDHTGPSAVQKSEQGNPP